MEVKFFSYATTADIQLLSEGGDYHEKEKKKEEKIRGKKLPKKPTRKTRSRTKKYFINYELIFGIKKRKRRKRKNHYIKRFA